MILFPEKITVDLSAVEKLMFVYTRTKKTKRYLNNIIDIKHI